MRVFVLVLLLSGCASGVQKMECDYANERRQQPSYIELLPDGGILIQEPVLPKPILIKPKKDIYG